MKNLQLRFIKGVLPDAVLLRTVEEFFNSLPRAVRSESIKGGKSTNLIQLESTINHHEQRRPARVHISK